MEKPISTNDSMGMIANAKAKKIQPKAKGKMPAGLAAYLAKKKAAKGNTPTQPVKK